MDSNSGRFGRGFGSGSGKEETSILPFSYRDLDVSDWQIRILSLLPSRRGDSADSVHCLLIRVADLDHAPKFMCMSYVWGDATVQVPIFVNGRILMVTRNLYNALRHFRDALCTAGSIALWVDAICINQADVAERNRQVQLMTIIYGTADSVLLWLGPEDEESDIAMDLISAFGNKYNSLLAKDFSTWSSYPPSVEAGTWAALDALFQRPFWRRIWILQEFVLAREFVLVCGHKTVRSDVFERAWLDWNAELATERDRVRHQFDEELADIMLRSCGGLHVHMSMRWSLDAHRQQAPSPRRSVDDSGYAILDVLAESRAFEATDPRDRIFGLLGITKHSIFPDYSRPTRDIYAGFARNQIDESRLDVLLMAGSGAFRKNEITFDLPSWAPDFQALAELGSFLPWLPDRFSAATALSTWSAYGVMTTSDLYRLEIEALVCGEVTEVPNLPGDGSSWLQDGSVADIWERTTTAVLAEPYPGGLPHLQAFFRTLLMDYVYDSEKSLMDSGHEFFDLAAGFLVILTEGISAARGQPSELDEPFDHVGVFQKWLRFCGKDCDRHEAGQLIFDVFLDDKYADVEGQWPEQRGMTDKSRLSRAFVERLEGYASTTSFFWTDNGYFGLGPKYCAKSDIVSIVPRMEFPLMFRALDDDNDIYEYVGPCFVLGLMYGEVVEGLDEDSVELQTFQVR